MLLSNSTQVVCLLPELPVANDHYDQLLKGCQELKDIAFNDWGQRAFIYTAVAQIAGYGYTLGYSCEREKEAADLLYAGTSQPPEHSILMDYEADNRTAYMFLKNIDYRFLMDASRRLGAILKNKPKNKTSIGCAYKRLKACYCVAY
ncbi:hypothetical protein Y032_0737g1943 [Ancylostoma ceylanicum]|uniref:Uncharacterized protein n=1 Tax=Ancylostoma ceylanicum TaxID=53326 RepID=A0A016WEW4_9BILA|nr:hypothetical protein Y032_0737g1943 [Ancylostoma ceylanicum]